MSPPPTPPTTSIEETAGTSGGHFTTLPLNGRDTRVGLVRLWDIDTPIFRDSVADAFASVWPRRAGECNAIRRGLYTPDRKPVALVLVPMDGPNARNLVLGYTIIYPSSTVTVRKAGGTTDEAGGEGSEAQASNCTLNSVFVPAHLRGLHLGQALVKLAVHTAVREMGFACVTAWCQPEKMRFYTSCGFVFEAPKRKTLPMGALSKGRKEALWAKLLGQETAAVNERGTGVRDTSGGGDSSASSDSGDDDGLDECMRLLSDGSNNLPPL
jgi:GNAT superfamily N-acetyltransferase